MKKLISFIVLFIISLPAMCAQAFDALADDTTVAPAVRMEYHANLCREYRAEVVRLDNDRYWLHHRDPKFQQMTADRRDDYVIDYVVTHVLRDRFAQAVQDNCVRY